MGIFELNLTMPEDFLLLAIIPSELYVFGHIFGRSKSYRKPLPSRCSSQLELSGTLSPISGLFYSGGGEKIHFQACTNTVVSKTCVTRRRGGGAGPFLVSPSLRTLRRLLSRYCCSDRSPAFTYGLSPLPPHVSTPCETAPGPPSPFEIRCGRRPGRLALPRRLNAGTCPLWPR
jgi:hypothetical protein